LVTSFNSGGFFASELTSSQAGGHLTPTSYSSSCGLRSLSKSSQSYVTTGGQSAILSWCQVASGAQDQISVTVRQLRVCSYEAPSLTRGRVCRLQSLLSVSSAVILTADKISRYMSSIFTLLHVDILHSQLPRVRFLWTLAIYSFTRNYSIYVCTIYGRRGIVVHALSHVAYVTTAA
jgi:hypothetical protein